MWNYNYTNELYHHGVKGMKWGVRRYQNEDGTLTSIGKRRQQRHFEDMSDKERRKYNNKSDDDKRKYQNKLVRQYADEDNRNLKSGLYEGANLSRNLSNMARKSASRNNKYQSMDLSNMTDKELRDRINRANLERQYNEMFAPRQTNKGRKYAERFLDDATDILTVGASAVSIALLVKQMRGK